MRVADEVLDEWNDHWEELKARLIRSDETWVYHENPHYRISGSKWRKRGSKPPEIPKLRSNPKPIVASIFWDSQAILLTDVLEPDQNIKVENYCDLVEVREITNEKRRGKLFKGVVLHNELACKVSH